MTIKEYQARLATIGIPSHVTNGSRLGLRHDQNGEPLLKSGNVLTADAIHIATGSAYNGGFLYAVNLVLPQEQPSKDKRDSLLTNASEYCLDNGCAVYLRVSRRGVHIWTLLDKCGLKTRSSNRGGYLIEFKGARSWLEAFNLRLVDPLRPSVELVDALSKLAITPSEAFLSLFGF